MRNGEWQQFAACATTDPDMFVPADRGGTYFDARKICATCEVAAPCLREALEADEEYGIRGGLTPTERKRLKRNGQAA